MVSETQTSKCHFKIITPSRYFQMAAEKTAFLSGGELPDGALLKSMSVPTGKQGVHEKLKGLGKHDPGRQSFYDNVALNFHRLGRDLPHRLPPPQTGRHGQPGQHSLDPPGNICWRYWVQGVFQGS
jgi:hypothetical protein